MSTKTKTMSAKLGSALAVFENTTKANQERNARDVVARSTFNKFQRKKPDSLATKIIGEGSEQNKDNEGGGCRNLKVSSAADPSREQTEASPNKQRPEVNGNFTIQQSKTSASKLIEAFESQKVKNGNDESLSFRSRRNFTVPKKNVSSVIGRFESSRNSKNDKASVKSSNTEGKPQIAQNYMLPVATRPTAAAESSTSLVFHCEQKQKKPLPMKDLVPDSSITIPDSADLLVGDCTTTTSPKSHQERHESEMAALADTVNGCILDCDEKDDSSYFELEVVKTDDCLDGLQQHPLEDDRNECSWEERTINTEEDELWEEETIEDELIDEEEEGEEGP